MQRFILASGTFYGFFSVALGAFAAHALENKLSEKAQHWFQLAVRYQMAHAIVLLIVGILLERQHGLLLKVSAIAFVVGTLIFSSTLYGLALGLPRWLGAITPIGGTSLLLGWLCLFISIISRSR